MHGGAYGSGGQPGNRNALKSGIYSRELVELRRKLRELEVEAREVIEQVLPSVKTRVRLP